MRLIDADALIIDDEICKRTRCRDCRILIRGCEDFFKTIKNAPTIEQPTTTWLGNYSPYTCKHCGKHTDSKTPFCAWCGRRASNYEM